MSETRSMKFLVMEPRWYTRYRCHFYRVKEIRKIAIFVREYFFFAFDSSPRIGYWKETTGGRGREGIFGVLAGGRNG